MRKNESRTAQAVGCTGLAVLLFAAFMAAYSAYYPDGRAAGGELLLRVGGGHGVGDDLHLAHRLLLVGYKLLGKVAIGGEACAGGGMSLPMMTFSYRPTRWSTLPLMAASVRTLVVSWKEAAERKESVAKEALVIPIRSWV